VRKTFVVEYINVILANYDRLVKLVCNGVLSVGEKHIRTEKCQALLECPRCLEQGTLTKGEGSVWLTSSLR
jgi:hypothetical protein